MAFGFGLCWPLGHVPFLGGVGSVREMVRIVALDGGGVDVEPPHGVRLDLVEVLGATLALVVVVRRRRQPCRTVGHV